MLCSPLRRIPTPAGVFAFLLLASLPSPTRAQFLHRSHTDIVDGTGKPVLLRGVNLGNWLYAEPWMTGNTNFAMFTDEGGKPDEMDAAVTDLVGAKRAASFRQAWRDNYVTQADVKAIAGMGFNSVRVPLDYRLFTDPATGRDVDTGITYLDRLLAWCAAAKIYAVPDIHSMPGGKLGWVKGNVYDSPDKQAVLAHVWGRIAAHYRDNVWIGGYDLVNEPAVWDAAKLGGLYRTLTKAVRQADTHHLVFVEGDAWGSKLDGLGLSAPSDVWDDNLALSDHDYGAPQMPDSMDAHKALCRRLDVPLWMGEFGYNSNTWYARQKALCERPDPLTAGWSLWAYKSSGIWSLTGFDIPDSYQKLQAYWDAKKRDPNTPKPPADAAFAALTELAQATTLPRCTRRRDVLDSLTRPDFATRAVPYGPGLTLPGTLLAIDYDLGAEGVAYHDTVSTDEAGKGPAGRAWNGGWNGRNDGVDVFPHSDGPAKYAIGGIDPGEWVQYTVTAKPGVYTLRLRYGGEGTGGRLRVSLNGVDLAGSITLPGTGGWDTFATKTVPNVRVTARGPAVLRLDFEAGGVNLSRIAFVPVTSAGR